MFKNRINSVLEFSKRRGSVEEVFADLVTTVNSVNSKGKKSANEAVNLKNVNTFLNGGDLEPYFANPVAKRNDCEELSETLYTVNPNYAAIINHFRDLYYWRYTTTPRKMKSNKPALGKEEYGTMYQNMLEVVEGSALEVLMPNFLTALFKTGSAAFYFAKNQSSKTVVPLLLPNRYVRAGAQTQHGTSHVIFDFTYFNSTGFKGEELERFLDMFPTEFGIKYKDFMAKKAGRWQQLSGKCSTVISLNNARFPTFLSAFFEIIDYKTYKINELERNTNKLERLLVQEIDMEKANIDIPEVKALHNSLAAMLSGSSGTRLLTSIGAVKSIPLQEDIGAENKTLSAAYDAIYNAVGINASLFNGSDDAALEVSLKRDLKFTWTFVERFMNFYNLAINNLYNFGDYQASVKMLSISPFDSDSLTLHKENATYGVGIMDYVVASGVKQVDLESGFELEDYLDLNNKLRPLQSAHTLSSSDNQALNENSGSDDSDNDKAETKEKDETGDANE